MPTLAVCYVEMVKAGLVRDLEAARRLREAIARRGFAECLEPLDRALGYVLTGDAELLRVNPIVLEVTQDVLAKLYKAGVPRL